MALPPLLDSGISSDDMVPTEASVDVSVPQVEDFAGGAEVTEDGQGGAVIQALVEAMQGEVMEEEQIPHNANLAEYLDDGYLGEISSDLRASYEDDMESRSEWEETYTQGLDQLGVKYDERTQPFQGASGVTHPLIAESVTQFQAQAYKELLPAGGPVKTQVLGLQDVAREEQASRVKDFMNYQIMEVMEEFDPDMDQLLFYLPLSGSTFKKVYYDEAKQRAVSKFVPAQDLVVPYAASDLATASRVTHVLRMDGNDIRKMQLAGFYRDVELSKYNQENEVREKIDDIQGTSRTYSDEVYTILEMHVDLDIEGFEDMAPDGEPTGIAIPYIVTLDEGSGNILSIRRNFEEGTGISKKMQYFVHYKFMPGLGFYGFGLIHMIGGLGRAATSILRQLIDAGTLANLPAGFKARGVRVRNDDEPLQPGEWRDIDAPGGNIRDAIIPLPYKEPSATLAQLLGALIEGGRRFVSLADQQTGDGNTAAPVGTTVAMLERGMKVMSAIHKRLHYAQRQEFRVLARIFRDNMPAEGYPYDVVGGDRMVMAEDFDGRVDVVPVSDPNIFSMAQRVTLAQTQLQLAQSNPQVHNLYAAYRRMYQALEVQNIDEVLPPPPQPQPLDPAIENARALMGEILNTFPEQDHDAHIRMHMAFMKTPLVATSPQVMGTFYAHVMEHVSQKSRLMVTAEIEGIIGQAQLAAQSGAIDPVAAQQQIAQVQQDMQDPGQMEKLISLQMEKIMAEILPGLLPAGNDPMSDPLVQIRMQELALKEKDLQRKTEEDQGDMLIELQKMQQQAAAAAARIESQEEIADNRNDVNRERIQVQRDKMRQGG
jgi:hypothetical protein